MDTRDLEYVLAIARTGNFSQAAKALYISQPALSQYIKRLEKSLQVTLFYRSRSRVELSPAGEYYVQKGEAILQQMESLEAAMRHWQQAEQKQISIGVSQFYGKYFLNPYLEKLRENLPGYRIQIVDGESHYLEEQIACGKLDFGIFPAPTTRPQVSFAPLGTEEILFAFSKDNREATKLVESAREKQENTLDLLVFQHLPFVLPKEGLKMHRQALRICKHMGFQPQSIYQSENLDTVYSLVNHNYGVGFLPDVIARNCNPRSNRTLFFHFKSRYNHRTIGLAYRENSSVNSLVPILTTVMQAETKK